MTAENEHKHQVVAAVQLAKASGVDAADIQEWVEAVFTPSDEEFACDACGHVFPIDDVYGTWRGAHRDFLCHTCFRAGRKGR